jgi:hypothetical protein
MPDETGGKQPEPDEVDRKLAELTREIGKSRIHEPSALERMVAARQAEKRPSASEIPSCSRCWAW